MLTLLRDLRRLRRQLALPAPDRGRSLAIRHVDAGSCNGCEHELTLAASPYYDLQRYGLGIVASPRHADVLLVTGTVTTRMREPLLAAYHAMPEPRRVVALGDCALGCDVLGQRHRSRRPRRSAPPGRPAHPRLPTLATDHHASAARTPRRRGRLECDSAVVAGVAYRYELRRDRDVIATGHITRDCALEVGEEITIGLGCLHVWHLDHPDLGIRTDLSSQAFDEFACAKVVRAAVEVEDLDQHRLQQQPQLRPRQLSTHFLCCRLRR